MIRIKFFPERITLPRRPKIAAELNPQPQAWQPKPRIRHAHWYPWMLVRPKQRKRRVADWLNPQPQAWQTRPKFRHAHFILPIRLWHKSRRVADWLNPQPQIWQQRPIKKKHLAVPVVHKKHPKIAAALPPVAPVTTWTPFTRKKHAHWYSWLLPRPRQRKLRIAPFVNPPPFTWQQHPVKKRHPLLPVTHKKRPKVGALFSVQPVAPSFTPFRRKHRPSILLPRHKRRQQTAGWLYTQTAFYVPPHRKKRLTRPQLYRRPIRRGRNTSIIGGRNFLLPPSQPWNWNGQAPPLNFTLGTVSKAWNWLGQAANLGFTLPAPAVRAWNWVGNSPPLSFTLGTVSKAWNWIARAAVITGGNVTPNLHKGYDIMRGVMRAIMSGITRPPMQ